MLVLVTYDVSTKKLSGPKRLRKIAKICLDRCQRVQNSCFECNVDPAQWTRLKSRLLKAIKEDEDSIRFYYLGKNWKRRVEHFGVKENLDLEGPLII